VVITFLGVWNDVYWPLIALSDHQMYTLSISLALTESRILTLCRDGALHKRLLTEQKDRQLFVDVAVPSA